MNMQSPRAIHMQMRAISMQIRAMNMQLRASNSQNVPKFDIDVIP
jgi:hypothetical protein